MSEDPAIRYLEHDADLGFEVVGHDLTAIWDRGARALVGVMTDVDRISEQRTVSIEVAAPDLASLWVASLAELLFRFEVDGLLLPRVRGLVIHEAAAEMTARFLALGEPYDPDRHPGDAGIKAVTHHGAVLLRGTDGRWRGRVLLDL